MSYANTGYCKMPKVGMRLRGKSLAWFGSRARSNSIIAQIAGAVVIVKRVYEGSYEVALLDGYPVSGGFSYPLDHPNCWFEEIDQLVCEND